MRRFDPGPRLQNFLLKFNKISIVGLLSTPVRGCGFFALNRGESAKIGLNWVGSLTKTGPYLHHDWCISLRADLDPRIARKDP